MLCHPPSRARRILKWTGLVVCVVILVAWAVSLVVTLGYGAARWTLFLSDGAGTVNHLTPTAADQVATPQRAWFEWRREWEHPLWANIDRRLCYTTLTVPLASGVKVTPK